MPTHLSLAEAAERVYRELSGAREPILHPRALDAASAALSAFVPIHPGERVTRADLESALAKLRRAGVCFSEVRS
jgi:hypothetical protein